MCRSKSTKLWSNNGAGVKPPRKVSLLGFEVPARLAIEQCEEGKSAKAPCQARIGEQLHIIVVHMLDDFAVVNCLVTRRGQFNEAGKVVPEIRARSGTTPPESNPLGYETTERPEKR
jgi:hypothetical protein